jgi:hypothetical protein
MKKKLLFLLIYLFCGVFFVLFADVPLRSEELIYSIMAFNGRDYSGTFAKEDAGAIYLMADVDNFLSVRKTMIYYWPITSEWRTDTDTLSVLFDGSLELDGPDIDKTVIKPTRYTYYNKRDEYEYNWFVEKGDAADKAYAKFLEDLDNYYTDFGTYQQEKAFFDYTIERLTNKIMEMRDEGHDVDLYLEQLKKLVAPEEPVYPDSYNVVPVPVSEGMIINLPVGEYTIRFLNEDGAVVEGSDCKLVMFEKRRSEGVGYEVIPGDKWTRAVESNKSSSVLYINGSTDLFVRPFYQQEYNDLNYEKMLRNDAKGNPGLMKWVRIQQVPQSVLQITSNRGEIVSVVEEPYVVEQIEGTSLGYKIVPYDPEGTHKDMEPSLISFRIPLEPDVDKLELYTIDKDGTILNGSRRQIRLIKVRSPGIILVFIALLPLIIMFFVRLKRNRQYAS